MYFSFAHISQPFSSFRWREMNCFAVKGATWTLDDKFSIFSFNLQIADSNSIPGYKLRTHLQGIMTWNNWEIIAEPRTLVFFRLPFLLNLRVISPFAIQIKACQARFFLNLLNSKSFTCVGPNKLMDERVEKSVPTDGGRGMSCLLRYVMYQLIILIKRNFNLSNLIYL